MFCCQEMAQVSPIFWIEADLNVKSVFGQHNNDSAEWGGTTPWPVLQFSF